MARKEGKNENPVILKLIRTDKKANFRTRNRFLLGKKFYNPIDCIIQLKEEKTNVREGLEQVTKEKVRISELPQNPQENEI